MEKPQPPDPTCPTCKGAAEFARVVNTQVEFWECVNKHMFVVDRKIAKPTPAAAAAAAAVPDSDPVDG
jgi:Zn ribbon nucleic-acid-binding protein